MGKKSFGTSELVAFQSAPTLIGYDPALRKIVIGEAARTLASRYRPVIQDFKLAIGDSDAVYNGKSSGGALGRPQRGWELGTDGNSDRYLSTREAAKIFLQEFLKGLPNLPPQLILGIPASRDKAWLALYKAHLVELLEELGHPDTQFFPEPFAVFQYYRHVEELIPKSSEKLAVLVVDFGGGTMDSCVIETTIDGNLSRGGTTASPLGIQSSVGAGKEVDKALLACAMRKSSDVKLRQETIDARVSSRPWVLLVIEEMKIALSDQMTRSRLDEDCRQFTQTRELPAGSYHPDKSVTLELTGEDLKTVVKDLWFEKAGPGAAVVKTISEARYRKGVVYLQQLDKVILAGGSSRLPFLRELLTKSIAGQISFRPDDVLMGSTSEQAVALGIAVEATQERNRAKRTHHSVGSCIFTELYFISAPRRRERAVLPKIKLLFEGEWQEQEPGTLLSGPTQLDEFSLEFLIELPFRPHASLIYWFCDTPDLESAEINRLNVGPDNLHVPPKSTYSFNLRITFDPDRGLISPFFTFGKETLAGIPFHVGGLKISREVSSYAGIDFGTSNSYAVTLWTSNKDKESKYPVFRISESAGERLRALEIKIAAAKNAGILTPETVRIFAKAEQANFVFHSVKIEGNSLSRGETEALLDGSSAASSQEMLEPINVRDAYEFSMENTSSLSQTPEMFMRELHKMVLKDIGSPGGIYRREQVSLSGMVFSPPDWTDVEPFMAQLASELRQLSPDKTALQHAAEIHSKFTSIHPFHDGNGRTARLIMNAILLDVGLPAITIAHSDKQRYLDGLSSSNQGDISELCILFAECLESSVEQMSGNIGIDEPVDLFGVAETPVTSWVPSEKLASLMRSRVERAPVDRKIRYEAWAAAFESLREDFKVCCQGFNDLYNESLYHTELSTFDRVPYEKYEDLLRRKPIPKTWLMGLELGSDVQSEKFVFWFRHISADFQQACKIWSPSLRIPPKEVSLAISRRIDGTFQPLSSEPIRLREIANISGEWLALTATEDNKLTVEPMTVMHAAELFLEDAIFTYL